MRPGEQRRRRERGFTYLGLMIALLILGIGLAAVGSVARSVAQAERERQLLFVGHEFRNAIGHFYRTTGRFPPELELLITDPTRLPSVHHLRRLYLDPMTGLADWRLLRTLDGGIYGVYSSSAATPRKRANFGPEDPGFDDAACYREWRFLYVPRNRPLPALPVSERCPGG